MVTLYGISGYARVGKDSFAEILADELLRNTGKHPKRFSFARKLKELLDPFLMETLGISAFTTDDEKKKIIRPILVSVGEAARKINPNFWINKIAPEVKATLDSGLQAIVTDVRYDNEAEWVHSFADSKVIGLIRNGISAPNNEEAQSIPLVFEMADSIIKWPEISHSQEMSVIGCEELVSVVQSVIAKKGEV